MQSMIRGARGLTVEQLLAFHREQFGSSRMEDDKSTEGDDKGDQSKQEGSDHGRGAGTDAQKPISEMTDAERASYFEVKAGRYRDNLRKFDGVDIDALKDKATKHDALEHELMSDKDKAVADARTAANTEADGKYLPKLAQAELRIAAAGKVGAERLAQALEFTDLRQFLNGEEVDAEKVTRFVESLGSDVQGDQSPARRGPSSSGQGNRSSTSAPSLDAGREAFARRHGKKGE